MLFFRCVFVVQQKTAYEMRISDWSSDVCSSDLPTSWVVANGYYNLAHADEIRELYRSTVDPGILLSDDLTMTRVFDITAITMSAYIQADGELTIFVRPLRLKAGVRYHDVDTDVPLTVTYSFGTARGYSGTWKFPPRPSHHTLV